MVRLTLEFYCKHFFQFSQNNDFVLISFNQGTVRGTDVYYLFGGTSLAELNTNRPSHIIENDIPGSDCLTRNALTRTHSYRLPRPIDRNNPQSVSVQVCKGPETRAVYACIAFYLFRFFFPHTIPPHKHGGNTSRYIYGLNPIRTRRVII